MSILDSLKSKASSLTSNSTVKSALDFVKSDKGKQTIKETTGKVEGFVEKQTHGKGIFGFGKK